MKIGIVSIYFFLVVFILSCSDSNERRIVCIELKSDWKITQSSNNYKEYGTFFNLDKTFLSFENIDILCDNIIGDAKIYLNDSLLISHISGGFMQVSCKSLFKLNGNRLTIVFTAPLNLKEGIWEPVKLRAWNNVRIDNAQFILTSLTANSARYNAEIITIATSDTIANIDILVNQKHVIKIRDLMLTKGLNKQLISFTIPNPKLWWTNGLGLPHLYNIVVKLQTNGKLLHEYQQRIGIRKFDQLNSSNSAVPNICKKLNNVPLYIKGACFTPTSACFSDSLLIEYKQIIEEARKTNVNLLYVADSNFYGKELFSSMCEENGIIFNCISNESRFFTPLQFGCSLTALDSIKKYYNYSGNPKSFAYYSNIYQSDKIKTTIENYRLKNSSCGLLFNQFNETGFSLFESSLNFLGNWKPANYILRNAYSSCTVVPVYKQGKVEVYIINDELKEMDGILLCKLIDFYGKDYFVKQIPVTVQANSILKAITVDAKDLFLRTTATKACLTVQLSKPGQTIAQNILYFKIPKNLQLPAVSLIPDINVVARNFNLIFKSNVLVKNIVLATKQQNVFFSDNNFDLLPRKRIKISVVYKGTLQQFKNELDVNYLNPIAPITK